MQYIDKLAFIVPNEDEPNFSDKPTFLTRPEEPLQFAIYSMKKGHKIQAHIHKTPKQEVMYIKEGVLAVSIFDTNKVKVREVVIRTGDSIWLGYGGHSFQAIDNTVVIYCKLGPYEGKEADKEVF